MSMIRKCRTGPELDHCATLPAMMKPSLLSVLAGLLIVVSACGGKAAPLAPTPVSNTATSIPCDLVGTLPCQVPPPAPVSLCTDPYATNWQQPLPCAYPPPVPVPAPPPTGNPPSSTPSLTSTCGVSLALVVGTPLGDEYLWLSGFHGIHGSYAAWIQSRCDFPGIAAIQDAQYAAR